MAGCLCQAIVCALEKAYIDTVLKVAKVLNNLNNLDEFANVLSYEFVR